MGQGALLLYQTQDEVYHLLLREADAERKVGNRQHALEVLRLADRKRPDAWFRDPVELRQQAFETVASSGVRLVREVECNLPGPGSSGLTHLVAGRGRPHPPRPNTDEKSLKCTKFLPVICCEEAEPAEELEPKPATAPGCAPRHQRQRLLGRPGDAGPGGGAAASCSGHGSRTRSTSLLGRLSASSSPSPTSTPTWVQPDDGRMNCLPRPG